MTNEVLNKRTISNAAVVRDIIGRPLRNRVKSYSNLRKSVTAVVAGRMPSKLFFVRFATQLLIRFIRDAIFSIAVCAILDLHMAFVLVYVVVRTFLIIYSVSRMFMDEFVGINKR